MSKLSKAYIDQHRDTGHTYAQFGQLMVNAILDKTENILGTSEMDQVSFTLEFEVSPFAPTDCLKICVKKSNGEVWCIKQFEDDVYRP